MLATVIKNWGREISHRELCGLARNARTEVVVKEAQNSSGDVRLLAGARRSISKRCAGHREQRKPGCKFRKFWPSAFRKF
jgi:hypothetical protein